MSPTPLERRIISRDMAGVAAQRRDDQAPRIVGYAAVYYDGTPATEYPLWDGAVERILPGAFDRAAAEDDVRALVNHDANLLLGRTAAGTLGLTVDGKGLRYEIEPPDTQAGRDAVVSLERGDLSGSSFSFVTTDETWIKEDEIRVREIRGVRLFDVGPVTFPAYESTTSGLRADGELAEARASLAAAEAAQRAREAEAIDLDVRLAEVRAAE